MEIAVHDTACRLAERGHEIIVYCRPDGTTANHPLPENIRLIYIPTLNTKYLGAFIHALLSSLHVLFIKADIVHYQALGPSFFSFLPRLSGKKTVVTIHSLDWKRKKWNAFARSFLKLCEFTAVFFPNKTITVSRTLKKYYESRFGKKARYIPNAVSTPEISTGPGFKQRDIILFTGRLVPEKRVDCLIRAYNDIRPDMDLVIAGGPGSDPKYAFYLRDIAAGNDKIKFPGRVGAGQLDDLYRRAYIFVLPSEVEGSPLSLLEAMSYGVCPVTADIPECAEIAGDAAVYFRPGDHIDLRDKIKSLIDASSVCAEKGAVARTRAAENYRWEGVIDALAGLYVSLKRP